MRCVRARWRCCTKFRSAAITAALIQPRLFLWLFGRYVATTGDLKFAEELWPHVDRALRWIEQYGDPDGDGYVEYMRETPQGLANQGWKDSFDSISHADGTLARAADRAM